LSTFSKLIIDHRPGPLVTRYYIARFRYHANLEIIGQHSIHFQRTKNIQQLKTVEQGDTD
jgi:hypothetical protein